VTEKFTEVAATKLTPKQLAFANVAQTFAKVLNDPEFSFHSEREGQGTDSAFYRAAILYFSKAIMSRLEEKTKAEGFNLLSWVKAELDVDANSGSKNG